MCLIWRRRPRYRRHRTRYIVRRNDIQRFLIECSFSPFFLADGEPLKLPESLESLPKSDHFPGQRHRWNTNEVSYRVSENKEGGDKLRQLT